MAKLRKKAGKRDAAREKPEKADESELSLAQRVWHQVSPVGSAVAIALVIRALVLESFYVPSGSMLPTLLIGDHVFVNKFLYGARIPFTDVRLPDRRDPERGEVMIFSLGRKPSGSPCPLDRCPEPTGSEGFVKRIVAIPGDTVEVRDGRVIVNGRLLEQRDLGRTFLDDHGNELAMACESQDGRSYAVLDNPMRDGIDYARITVDEGRYFAMGDNRDDSNDSRVWGTVHRNDIKGPVMIIYWSWNNRESWAAMANPLTWIRLIAGETRWDRFGDALDELCRE